MVADPHYYKNKVSTKIFWWPFQNLKNKNGNTKQKLLQNFSFCYLTAENTTACVNDTVTLMLSVAVVSSTGPCIVR